MKQAIKKRLKRHPAIFNPVYRIYRKFFPAPDWPRQLQTQILKSLKKESVFFVQVGSNDGVRNDPLHSLIVANKEWKGIFIEPMSSFFECLKRNYGNSDRFIFENKAISSHRGEIEFFYVSEKARAVLGDALPNWHDQLGSFDRNHLQKHLRGILTPYIISDKINTVTLQDIFDKHAITEIDLLHIDTEGHDYKVLSTLDFSRYKPLVILYEHIHLSEVDRKSAEALLRRNGYSCHQYGRDTLATIKG